MQLAARPRPEVRPALARPGRVLLPVALLLLAGCVFLPGRAGLERLIAARGEPDAVTVFSAAPAPGEQPLAGLRATLLYWSARGAGGRPRWQGVLEPHPEDLYERILRALDAGAARITLKAYRYDAIGLEEITLVDYLDEAGTPLGWDCVPYGERGGRRAGRGRLLVGYNGLLWWEYPQMLLDLPVYLAVGIKELAFEAVKSPLSFLDGGWLATAVARRNPFSPVCFERAAGAFVEDWRDGFTALTWRLRARSRHTPLDLLRTLAGAAPVVGPFLDAKAPREDAAPPGTTSFVVVSQGIHAGDESEQFVAAWESALQELRPGVIVTTAPYRHGTAIDSCWAVLNLSSGPGYDLAAGLVFGEGVSPGDTIELAGFSGGAQRSVAAARALRDAGITVRRLVGVAGPIAGTSTAAETTLLLGDALDDAVVLSARAVELFYFLLPANVRVVSVPDAGAHHLPFFPDGKTRAPARGYARMLEELLGDR